MKDDRDDEFFTPAQESEIIEAIKKAEKNTSGEIRVHVENGHDDKDVLHRAGEVFATLGMDRTELGNGVLLYIDLKHHRFAYGAGAGYTNSSRKGSGTRRTTWRAGISKMGK